MGALELPDDDFAPLGRLFGATNIAVVGASADLDKIGGKPIRYLSAAGFTGVVVPVNPRHDTIAGMQCFSSVSEIPLPVDLAIIAVPGGSVESAIEDTAAAGVPFAVVFSSGFGEMGDDGRRRQTNLVSVARRGGLRLVGPNSLGITSSPNGMVASFASLFDRHANLQPGRVGFVSQSGAVGAFVYGVAQDDGLGFSRFVSVGNEADLDVADFLAFMADDPQTAAIGGYLEGVTDGRRFMTAADRVREAGKPMSFIKVGSSEAGRRAAASHTGSIAGTDAVYDAAFERAGVVRSTDPQGLLDFLRFHSDPNHRPARPGVAVLTVSGGCGVWCADRMATLGLEMAEFLPATIDRLTNILPPFASPQNPVDATGQIQNDPTMFEECLDAILDDPGVGTLVVALGLQERQGEAMARQIVDAYRAHPEACVVVAWLAGPKVVHTLLGEAGVPVFGDLARAVDVVGVASRSSQVSSAPRQRMSPADLTVSRVPTTEHEAKRFLADYGIPTPNGVLCRTLSEMTAAARDIGYPVAVKGQVAGVAHKTEHDLVHLGISSDDELAEAHEKVAAALERLGSPNDVDGVLVEQMAPAGLDVIVGTFTDDVFGPTVMFGLGGVLVELVDDVGFRICPVDESEALEMIASTRADRLLAGYRGSEPLDRDALASVVARVSELARSQSSILAEIELNPLRVTPEGVMALDALVIGHDRQ